MTWKDSIKKSTIKERVAELDNLLKMIGDVINETEKIGNDFARFKVKTEAGSFRSKDKVLDNLEEAQIYISKEKTQLMKEMRPKKEGKFEFEQVNNMTWKNTIRKGRVQDFTYTTELERRKHGRLHSITGGKGVYETDYEKVIIEWSLAIENSDDSVYIQEPNFDKITVVGVDASFDKDFDAANMKWDIENKDVVVDDFQVDVNFDTKELPMTLIPYIDAELVKDGDGLTLDNIAITFEQVNNMTWKGIITKMAVKSSISDLDEDAKDEVYLYRDKTIKIIIAKVPAKFKEMTKRALEEHIDR